MPTVKTLVEGYAKEEEYGIRASSTATLILENDLQIVVDPGINKQLLLGALKKEGLMPIDIDYVILTHHHPDHILNAALFNKAKFLDGELLYDEDLEIEHKGVVPDTKIKIFETPGHTDEHCSVEVKTEDGIIVIAGDVFWWSDDEEQELDVKQKDPYAVDQGLLQKSRELVLDKADYIIPGHGKEMRVMK